jgi:hypothetical protein
LAELVKDPEINTEIRQQVIAAADSVLKSSRTPPETREELEKRMEQ